MKLKLRCYSILSLAIVMLLGHSILFSQEISISEVPFFNLSGEQHTNAYSGGLRAPQLNKIDLNSDGLEDLLIFDRAGDILSSYIATDSNSVEYIYDPQWTKNFPKLNIWMRLADYNGDGIQDLFSFPESSGLPGVQVHTGSIVDGYYSFEKVLFPEERSDILFYPISNGKTQVYVSVIDIPVIKDVDNDGDIDILSFDPGATTVNFYRNLAVEEHDGDLSVLDFIEEDGCYGRFFESGFSQDVVLSVDGQGCGNTAFQDDPISVRHAGSTLEAFDADGDGTLDLLLGDASYNGLTFLINGGTVESPWMTESTLGYPAVAPVEFELFVTPYVLDIDNDGIDELMVVSNDTRTSQTRDNFWFYENFDSVGLDPELVAKDFLAPSIVDHGEGAIPAFCDYNADGLLDIVIGASGQFILTSEKEPTLFLYENTGTATSPEYTLVDTNYLNFNEFKMTSSFFAPSFGDLDGDGDDDLLVGDNRGQLYYAENTVGPDMPYSFERPVYEYADIAVSGYIRPTIYDLNNDGLGDIIAGERNFNSTDEVPVASINYYQNIGKVNDPAFEPNINLAPNNPALGSINLKQQNFISNNSSVSIWNDEKDLLFFTGSESGDVRLFTTDTDTIAAVFQENIETALGEINVGEESAVAVADIDGDLLLELVVGNYRGGIALYETDIPSQQIDSKTQEEALGQSIQAHPNPTSDRLTISSTDSEIKEIEVYDVSGRLKLKTTQRVLDLSAYNDGVYLLRIKTDKGLAVKKINKISH